MFVPFQSASRRRHRSRSLRIAILLTLALGLAGLAPLGGPPLQPPGDFPVESGQAKKCPFCGRAVRPDRQGRYTCLVCNEPFVAAEAEDYP